MVIPLRFIHALDKAFPYVEKAFTPWVLCNLDQERTKDTIHAVDAGVWPFS